jgi:hypothetical protein
VLVEDEAQQVRIEARRTRPLSVVTTIAPTRRTFSRLARKRMLVLGVCLGDVHRDLQRVQHIRPRRRIRSWARFIFETETISIALVILRVLCTLLILLRISFDPAIACPCLPLSEPATAPSTRRSS